MVGEDDVRAGLAGRAELDVLADSALQQVPQPVDHGAEVKDSGLRGAAPGERQELARQPAGAVGGFWILARSSLAVRTVSGGIEVPISSATNAA